ncbi:MAG: phosphoribosylanthranilate isomerase, partial [Saprospiraceae bacterium]|nr:phosphoribosylanthranilate isomerase [Saprospiraceae bacterium]
FKACGIRTAALLREPPPADYLGINFSPLSKRRIAPDLLDAAGLPARAVAVFFKNSETEIRELLARYPFEAAQVYAGDVSPEFVRSLKQKVMLACQVRTPADLEQLNHYALDVDAFILDGAAPGSGQVMETAIPADFPYPFLLAGGLHASKLELALRHPNCVGVDIASGIETAGEVDVRKIVETRRRLDLLSAPSVPAAR